LAIGYYKAKGQDSEERESLEKELRLAEDVYDNKRKEFSELKYDDKRKKTPSIIWYSRELILVGVAAFVVAFILSTFLAPLPPNTELSAATFYNTLQFSLPISFSALIVPSIIYAVILNCRNEIQNLVIYILKFQDCRVV